MNESLAHILDTSEPECLATGFGFTEGPCWHPDGYLFFSDLRSSPPSVWKVTPGDKPEVVLESDARANGLTFDLNRNLVMCEANGRRISRMRADRSIETVCDSFNGKRLNRPNDIICRSDGSLYFTDPAVRMPFAEREQPECGIYHVAPDNQVTLIANAEFPNGLALSLDERTLYVANSWWTSYLLAFDLDESGTVATNRRILIDMSSWGADKDVPDRRGVPDGMKVNREGTIFCTAAGGIWVLSPEGTLSGIIEFPEIPSNLVFGGPDLRTLFVTARTSLYSLRVKIPGQPHPAFA